LFSNITTEPECIAFTKTSITFLLQKYHTQMARVPTYTWLTSNLIAFNFQLLLLWGS